MACLTSLFLLATLTLSARGKALDPRDLPVTCESPAVNAGDTGRVTCHFNRDVTELSFPVSLSVEFYPDQQDGSVLLAECNWLRRGDTKCRLKSAAHRFLVKESGNMVLEMPKVTPEDTGRYVCQRMSLGNRSVLTPKSCFLSVNDSLAVHEPANASPADGAPDREEPSGHRGEKDRQAEASESSLLSIVLPVVLVSAAVVAVAVLAFVLIRRRRRENGVHGSESRQSADKSVEETTPLRENGVHGSESRQSADKSVEETTPLSTNPEDPGGERKSSQPTLTSTLTPENAALVPSVSSDALCSPIQEEGGELAHREGGHSSEREGEDPSEIPDRKELPADEFEAISEKKRKANEELIAKGVSLWPEKVK